MANAITSVSIKDFLVFKGEFTAEFCPGVNVLIGGNGSGKTTLMKAIYKLCSNKIDRTRTEEYFYSAGRTHMEFKHRPFEFLRMQVSTDNGTSRISVRSLHYGRFEDREKPVNGKSMYKDDFTGLYEAKYYSENELVFTTENFEPLPSIFIPVTDLLTSSKGLLEMIDAYEMDFDAIQVDILRNAQRPATRELKPNCSKVIDQLSNLINGEVYFEEGIFYVRKKTGRIVRFAVEASGLKRLSLLWKLLRNGLLESGTVLFWDEPEASINPELIPALVDILLELQRGGVQIFIATHSYDVARWFELNKTPENSLRYFNMRKEDDGIVADVADDYISLPNSVIEDAGNKLLRRVTQVAAEKAGVTLN